MISWFKHKILGYDKCKAYGHALRKHEHVINKNDSLLQCHVKKCKNCGIYYIKCFDVYLNCCYGTNYMTEEEYKRWRKKI